MKLQRIEIKNFRCFTDFTLQVSGDSIFVVGENGCGKSTLLNAVAKGLGHDRGVSFEDFCDPNQPIEIRVTLTDFDSNQNAVLSERIVYVTPPELKVGFRAVWDANSESAEIAHGYPEQRWKGSRRDEREALALLWLPAWRDVARMLSFLDASSVVKRLVQGAALGSAAAQTARDIKTVTDQLRNEASVRGLLDKAEKHLSELIPGIASSAFNVEVSVVTERDVLKELELLLAYLGSPLVLSRQSNGLAQLSIFAFGLEFATRRPAALILVDEPETSLHPHAQRALTRALRSLNNQALIATHSSNILEHVDARKVVRLHRDPSQVRAARPSNLSQEQAEALSRYATPETAEAFFARKVILVEGLSDRLALIALAERRGRNLDAELTSILALQGAGTFGSYLTLLGPVGLGVKVAGMCDENYATAWCDRLESHGLGAALDRARMEQIGFFVCSVDLEDELVRALGPTKVKEIIDAAGDAPALSTFSGQPANAGKPEDAILREFLQRRDRKVRYAPLLIAALDLSNVPKPLDEVLKFA